MTSSALNIRTYYNSIKGGVNVVNKNFNNSFYINNGNQKINKNSICVNTNKKGLKEIIEIKLKCEKLFQKNIKQKITITLNSEKDFLHNYLYKRPLLIFSLL